MRRLLAAVSCVLLSCGLLSLAPGSGDAAPSGSSSDARLAASPIEHVVIIYQENHTFDDTLGAVCEARVTSCDGFIGAVTLAGGATAANIVQPDIVPEVDHSPYSQKLALANKWNGIKGCRKEPYDCVSHVELTAIPNLAALADVFALSDATFAAGKAASFGAHVTLAAGTMNGFVGYNPVESRKGVPPRAGWGCPSNRDARWGQAADFSYEPSCIPTPDGEGPYRKSEVPYTPTIMERLEEAGRTWHIYAGTSQRKPSRAPLAFCPYFQWCYANRFDLEHNSSRADFVEDAVLGTLPSVSFLIPVGDVSQHNGMSMTVGDNYIGSMVAAVQASPQWGSTAVFITYDDCGCFYDHVQPPDGLGIRNPMVIVSPYAKPQYTDSVTAIQPYSMLAFIQHAFALGSLTDAVDTAYDYADSFDFGQQPLSGPPMTTQRISAAERAKLARLLAGAMRDPT